jgi:Imm-5 like putative immunity protein
MKTYTPVRKKGSAIRVAPRFKTGMTATSDYAVRLAPFDHKTLALWAADCAEHVLFHFEAIHPADDRPRRAIEAARAWGRGEITMIMARAAAVKTHAAARVSHHPAAVAAARAAGHAAGTAHMMGHARGAAAYAVVSAVAATPAEEQDLAATAEREWQLAKLRGREGVNATCAPGDWCDIPP